ncbi:hypothetical protein SCHPADRAFT_947573 [Schizopora paradoxa]|uniref:BTB domain-containing protein n=1 Tax=Schizopora paradoxa TaxID=27342 RepID=A0A0H2R044_9AGAM|nr:hypothetical protein SCHPADRAFT_947573 [Schizopora paradoxa]
MSLEVDETFQCNLLIIRVENRIFRAPRELFEMYSEVFKDMFSLPKVEDGQSEGESDDKPLFLDGILKDDFHAFLTALSAFDYESTVKDTKGRKETLENDGFPLYGGMNKERWIAVLRLSHLWNFEGVRLKAIEALVKEPALVHLERLKLAREFLIED